MGSVVPPHYVFMSRQCLVEKLRELASLLESGSSAIRETEVSYETSEAGEYLTVYRFVYAPSREQE